MEQVRECVVELRGATVYHSADPYKELSVKNFRRLGESVLEGVNLKVYTGEVVYLIGRVGSGKSSLLKTLYGELPLFEGTGQVVGFDLQSLRRKDVSALRRSIGVVFQDLQVLSECDVYENLAFVLRATGWRDEQGISKRIVEVLNQVGLERQRYRLPFELSGGECQRLMIARALLGSPKLIIADEPTGNLDPVTAEGIICLFHEIAASGTAVVIATHNTALVESYPARTLLFSKGEVKEVEFDD
ncbi:MAG: ATP-binding cassette domain-containing protein [Rikenellaceae bacterium]|nr:ATP-binding cassette domain-containing protein [Rikenellaceae bacterium]